MRVWWDGAVLVIVSAACLLGECVCGVCVCVCVVVVVVCVRFREEMCIPPPLVPMLSIGERALSGADALLRLRRRRPHLVSDNRSPTRQPGAPQLGHACARGGRGPRSASLCWLPQQDQPQRQLARATAPYGYMAPHAIAPLNMWSPLWLHRTSRASTPAVVARSLRLSHARPLCAYSSQLHARQLQLVLVGGVRLGWLRVCIRTLCSTVGRRLG